jgi:RNase P/RNase MRP subunit p29
VYERSKRNKKLKTGKREEKVKRSGKCEEKKGKDGKKKKIRGSVLFHSPSFKAP